MKQFPYNETAHCHSVEIILTGLFIKSIVKVPLVSLDLSCLICFCSIIGVNLLGVKKGNKNVANQNCFLFSAHKTVPQLSVVQLFSIDNT